MKKLSAAIAENESFQSLILFLIIATAVVMGLETMPEFTDRYGDGFLIFHCVAQVIFVIEILVRMLAASSLRAFFKGGWNRFDFIVVALSLIPAIGSFVLIARLLRLLRVLRVFSTSDRLRSFVARLAETLDEILYGALIAAIFAYIYAVTGFYLFVDADPAHWGTLARAGLSVFYLVLAQDVPGFVEPVVANAPAAILYFAAFYITFIGLFIGIITAALQTGKARP